MRKFFSLALALLFLTVSSATNTIIKPVLKASEILIPVGKTGQKISLLELSRIPVRELEMLKGQKMSFFDKLSFRAAQKKIRDGIDTDGTINNKKFNKFFAKKGGDTGVHFGGLALGFFLGAIGIVIAYVIQDDYKRNRVKWAWIGFGLYLALFIIFLLSFNFAGYE